MNDKENKNNEKWIVLTNNIVTSIFFYFEWFFKHTLGVKAVMFFLCIVEYGRSEEHTSELQSHA